MLALGIRRYVLKNANNLNRQTIALDLVKERLAQQIESVKSLDIKASIVLAIIGFIFTGYLQSVIKQVNSIWLRGATLSILILAAIFAVITFVQVRHDWRNDPDPDKLLDIIKEADFRNYTDEEISAYILGSMAESYEDNKILYARRYRFLYISLALVLVAAIMIVIQAVTEGLH